MNIGISSNALKNSGGLERYAMDLVRGFGQSGIKPTFFTREHDRSLVENAWVDLHRVRAHLLPGKLRDYYFSWAVKRLRAVKKVDVLIGCNRVDSAEIAICGGTHLGYLRASGKRARLSDKWQVALERRQYANASMIVAHSERMREELCDLYGVESARVRVLYPPANGERFKPADDTTRQALRKQYGFGEDEVVLLFPSSSHKRKGLALIEQALQGSTLPIVIAVAGRAPDRPSSRVRYMGYVKDIEALYRAADLTVLASNYEPFGLVAVESVMCGTPVVMPSIAGCCEVIDKAAMFSFRSGDPTQLRDAILRGIASRRLLPRADVTSAHIAYEPSIGEHVRELLAMAQSIHGLVPRALALPEHAEVVHHAL